MNQVTSLRPDRLAPVGVVATQGTLALDLEPQRTPPPVPVTDQRRREVEAWAQRFAGAAAEIVGGDRPATQMVRWASRTVFEDLERRANLVAVAGGHRPGAGRVQPVRPRVVSVHSHQVTHSVVECSAHVRYGQRSRAMAMRFERRRDRDGARWVCTILDFGPQG